MLSVDFHCHTHFSRCGVHSLIEVLTEAKRLGMQGLAITDHGSALNSTTPPTYFDRLFDPVPGIRMIKGIECNIIDNKGVIDLPAYVIKYLDIILLGIHPNVPANPDQNYNTEMLLTALQKNRAVDIITHPNDNAYLVDFNLIAKYAAQNGMAIELNNSKTALQRIDDTTTRALVAACKKAQCRIAVNSDAHGLQEIGQDSAVLPFLAEVNYPKELIVNHSADSAFAFVAERKQFKC